MIGQRDTPERSPARRDTSEEPGPPKISVCGFFEDNHFAQRLKDKPVAAFCGNRTHVRAVLEIFIEFSLLNEGTVIVT